MRPATSIFYGSIGMRWLIWGLQDGITPHWSQSGHEALATNAADMDDVDDKSDNLEFGLEDHDVEGWEDVE